MAMSQKMIQDHPFLLAAAAGLLAGVVTGRVDRLLDRLVSEEQKARDRQVREAPAHVMAGPHIASKIRGRTLTEKGKKQARAVFEISYGVGWGLIYAKVRRKFPRLSRLAGLPFSVPFFFVCDGFMAPLLGVSPNLRRIPWQPSLKEMGNHIAWTATVEMILRRAARFGSRQLPQEL